MSSTNFVNGSTLSDAGWANDVDTFTYQRLTSVSGTNTIVGTGPVSMTAYAVGQEFAFIPAATNTGATKLNITPSGASALGEKNIFWNGAACVGGEIRINVPAKVWYDGTQFNLMAQPTARVFGTTTNDNAAAGYIGEFVESSVTGVNVASASVTPMTSIALTAGDWDISAVFNYDGGSGPSFATVGVGTTSGSLTGTFGKDKVYAVFSSNSGSASIPRVRASLSGSATYYLNAQLNASGTQTCEGYISARRIR